MGIPASSLHNQKIQKKSHFRFGFVFLFLFIASVGLNIFLIFFNQESNVATLPQHAEMASQMSYEQSKVLSKVPNKEVSQPVAVIKSVSYKVPLKETPNGRSIHTLNLKVRSSLNYTLCKILTRENGCAALSAHLGRLMTWFMDIKKSIRNGDNLIVIYQQLEGSKQFKILKLSYKSQYFGKTFKAYYFDGFDQGNGGYFDSDGSEIAKRIIEAQSPIRQYIEITSLPGDFRKKVGGHSGTDFKAKVGTPVYSGFAGKVVRANWNVRANGYCIEIDHPQLGIKTLYLHLSRVKVKRGQAIKAGQKIAESGNTGRSFAPHLHYEIQNRKNKKSIYNPFTSNYHKSYTRNIPPKHQQAFQKTVILFDSIIKES